MRPQLPFCGCAEFNLEGHLVRMKGKAENTIRLAGIRKDDMSIEDIRAFFAQLPDILAEGPDEPPVSGADESEQAPMEGDDAEAMRGILDDLTLVFRRALERSVGRRELPETEDLDGLSEALTMIFRSAVSMSRRGNSAEEIRRYIDIALGVLD